MCDAHGLESAQEQSCDFGGNGRNADTKLWCDAAPINPATTHITCSFLHFRTVVSRTVHRAPWLGQILGGEINWLCFVHWLHFVHVCELLHTAARRELLDF